MLVESCIDYGMTVGKDDGDSLQVLATAVVGRGEMKLMFGDLMLSVSRFFQGIPLHTRQFFCFHKYAEKAYTLGGWTAVCRKCGRKKFHDNDHVRFFLVVSIIYAALLGACLAYVFADTLS